MPISVWAAGCDPADQLFAHRCDLVLLARHPVLSAFTGAHGEYHTPRDTPEKINYPGTEKVVQLLAKMAGQISRKDLKPDFISMKKPEGQENRGGLRVYLGSIPDYASGDVKGLKLAGVSGRRPG